MTRILAASASPGSSRPSPVGMDRPDLLPSANIDELTLQLSMTQTELSQLRSDMAVQKAAADRESTSLRGQLAEAHADARSLRLQINRLQAVVGLNGRTDSAASMGLEQLVCSNCQRLQRLLDLLQTKARSTSEVPIDSTVQEPAGTLDTDPGKRSGSDRSCQTDLGDAHIAPTQLTTSVVDTAPSKVRLEQWEKELGEFEHALRDKELELQKENGRLSFEADRLKRKHEALVARETKLKEDIDSHEAQIESQRVELQNDMLQLGRERNRLAQERQTVESDRVRVHQLEVELQQKRREAEMLIEMATREHQARRMDEEKVRRTGSSSSFKREEHLATDVSTPEVESLTAEHRDTPVVRLQLQTKEPGSALDGQTTGITTGQFSPEENFAHAVAFLSDWLEKSIGQIGKKLSTESRNPVDTGKLRTMSEVLDLLRIDLLASRGQWMTDKAVVPVTKTAAPSKFPSELHRSDDDRDGVNTNTEHLMRRLRAAEQEAQEATEQLKSSNAEFLTLRERLSHAMVERAHLKATVESLDEEVRMRVAESMFETRTYLDVFFSSVIFFFDL
ncbi:unnamed protein product [Echinostoma caproni]|uniref:PACT_coil_coil domain-containing protein n=1 Tax=Echinostoma caproni TaxID=27848 RepID=A0A183BDM8_9TREM|nr:unnamed protein product [Echinostoma caproni]